MSASRGEGEKPSPDDNDSISDDYVDADFAALQKTISHHRRASRLSSEAGPRIENVFPTRFSPHVRPLTILDLDSCVALEQAAFPDPEHRASAEKFRYRLTVCPELSLGLFSTVVPSQLEGWHIETLASARPVETARPDGAVSLLVGHIVSTMTRAETVTDADMMYPQDWASRAGKPAGVGHQPDGRTAALHSLAVSPKLQGCGLGQMMVKAYLQQIKGSGMADRVALICQDVSRSHNHGAFRHCPFSSACPARAPLPPDESDRAQYLVDYYKRFGFEHRGHSRATFGGGGWHDMVFELAGPSEGSEH